MNKVYRDQFDPSTALKSALRNRAGFNRTGSQPAKPAGKWEKRARKWRNSILKRTRRLLILKESMFARLARLMHRS